MTMPNSNLQIDIDARKVMKDFQIKVQMKNTFAVRLGLIFIKIGCLIAGTSYVEEFPLSILQDDEEVEIERIGSFKEWLNKQ